MVRKVMTVILAAPAVALLTAGTALAEDHPSVTVSPSGSEGFNEAPIFQHDLKTLVNIAGPLVDARCAAPWTDGPAAGAIGTDYNACDTATMDNQRTEAPNHGLLSLT